MRKESLALIVEVALVLFGSSTYRFGRHCFALFSPRLRVGDDGVLYEMDMPQIIKVSEIRHKKRRGPVSEASI